MIPKYEKTMLPFLKYLVDGKEHGLSETHDALAEQFKLTDDELRELLPSGRQPIFRNRVGWASTYLKKAGLVTSPKRAHFKISANGLSLLKENPNKITSKSLTRYDDFVEFQSIKKDKKTVGIYCNRLLSITLTKHQKNPLSMLTRNFIPNYLKSCLIL
jgi:restriction system protein